MPTYQPTIGLEIHAELKTKTKMFCYSRNDPDEKHPNMNVCPVCMGHPGTLPVINKEAVTKVILVGLALDGEIPAFSQFDRKNYFYPDLPKGYQISQYEHPLVKGGHLDIKITNYKLQITNLKNQNEAAKKIRITRIHLEEDTGRLIHDPETKSSLVDFNRAGVPLMELVTEPDFSSGGEVRAFGEELQRILRYVGASDANMEKGQMRVEVNISLRPETRDQRPEKLGTKVEIKNINSFKFAADAIEYEIKRQSSILERGDKVIQETRGWDENRGQTFSQRIKEEAHDYRYFPEPDLPPLSFTREFVESLRASLPELPEAKRRRFGDEYGIDESIAALLVRNKAVADYYESVVSELAEHEKEAGERPRQSSARSAALFLTSQVPGLLEGRVSDMSATAENMAELIFLLKEDKISNLAAKETLKEMFTTGQDPSDIIDEKGLWQVSDASDLENIARHIVTENPDTVKDYGAGKTAALQFLVGQVMKETRGKANPKVVQDIIRRLLHDST